MNRAERRRKSKDDERQLKGGIDADSSDPAGTAAMTRLMSELLETAKSERNIEPPVKFLHAKVDATLTRCAIFASTAKRAAPIAAGCG